MNTYTTAKIAAIIGIHPNTVRLYEKLELIPKPERKQNGYRVFTDFHIKQFQLARTAFQIEILQNGLRKKVIEIIKVSAKGDFDKAIILTKNYLNQLLQERNNAMEAIKITEQILYGKKEKNTYFLNRKEVSKYLDISIDTLRNWERNNLLTVDRKQKGYYVYTNKDIQILKIIRSLRCANYSLEAILRMLQQLSQNPKIDIKKALNTPKPNTDIISVGDKLIISLLEAEKSAKEIINMLNEMKIKF